MYQIRSRPQKIHFRRLRKIYRKFLASRKSVLECSRQTRKKRSDKTEYRAAQLRKVQFIGSNEKNPRTQQRYTDFLVAPGRACAFGAKLRGRALRACPHRRTYSSRPPRQYKKGTQPMLCSLFGCPWQTRTVDTAVNSRMLYRLS